MDKKEIAHIRLHLQSLSKVTICNTDLLNSLIKRGLLSNEESSRLVEVRSKKGHWQAAKQLYTILMETSDQLSWLLNLPVKFSGESVTLQTKFPTFYYEDAYQVLKGAGMDKGELSLVTNIKMNPELPPLRPLYIPRSISNRRKLDPKIFRENCLDVFVFQGLSKNLLDQIVSPNFSSLSSEHLYSITTRYIYLEKDEEWGSLLRVAKHPMHWVIKEGHDYILHRSTLLTDVILRFSSQARDNKHLYVSEENFIQDVITAKDGKGALICDLPGMGKSWFMETIARKLRSHPESPDTVVFFIPLPKLSKYLTRCEISDSSEASVKTILGYKEDCNLSDHLLCYLARHHNVRLIFVLDGFDEVPQKEVDITTKFVEDLNKEKNITLIVSSRPHLRCFLERKFNLISFDIHPFATHEQINCITSVWRGKFPDCKEDKLQNLAKQCIAGMTSIKKDNLDDALGVPLKCYILATVNEKMAEQVTNIGSKSEIHVPGIAILNTTSDFYDAFVKNRMAKINPQDEVHQVLNFHIFTALELLFPDIATPFWIQAELQHSNIDVLRPGILIHNSQQQVSFIHRSFAEYFAGKFFSDFWTNLEGEIHKTNFTRQIGHYFIERVLATNVEYSTTNWSPINFNQVGLNGISSMNNIRFEVGATLCFMENILSTRAGSRSFMGAIEVYKNHRVQHSTVVKAASLLVNGLLRLANLLTSWEEELSRSTILCLAVFACVEARLPFICGLIGNLMKSLSKGYEVLRLPKTNQKVTISLLLSKIASENSIVTGKEVFNIFAGSDGIDLIDFCQNYPEEFYSPLEIAIAANNEQMVHFFFDKVKIPKERLLLRCLLGTNMNETEINTRIYILDKVIRGDESNELPLTRSDAKIYLASLTNNEETNFELFKCLSFKTGMCLFYLPRCCKAALLRMTICKESDWQFFYLILLLFCKRSQTRHKHSATTDKDNYSTFAIENKEQAMNATFVLQSLDLADAYETFISLNLDQYKHPNVFKNIRTLEALKVLIRICPDFTKCNIFRWNYLHLAVKNGNVDWVKHLLSLSQDAKQTNHNNGTPMHYISCPTCLEITELLVAKGADMFAVDCLGRNVAHKFFETTCTTKKEGMAWVRYTLSNGYAELYNMRNTTGQSPLEILIGSVGINHPLVTYICTATQSDPTACHRRTTWRRLINYGNDEQLLKQLQIDFCQQETLNAPEIIPVKNIIGRIDVNLAKGVLLDSAPYGSYPLQNIRDVETLKLLLEICNDFSLLNKKKCNYLHIAVNHGRVDWVKHLIIAEHDINQRNREGKSPLLCIATSDAIQLTRLLVQNGADIYLTNTNKRNVAHCMSHSKFGERLYAWVAYTLEMGYEKLWHMKDRKGETPFENFLGNMSMDIPLSAPFNMKSLLFFFNEDFRANISQYRAAGLLDGNSFIKLVFEQKLSLQHMKTDKKIWLLSGIMETTSNDRMAKLLLLLFPNYSVRLSDISKSCPNDHPNFNTMSDVEENQILQLLNVEDVELHLKKLRIDRNRVFNDIKSVNLLELKF